MANNNRTNIKRPLMEALCTGNLTDDTTEEETVAPLGVIGTTHLRENSLVRRQYTGNRKFSECIHFRILQQFTETVLELNRLSFKSRDLINQSLTAIMKLRQSDKRNKYTPHGGLSPRAKHREKGTGNGYSRGCFVAVLLHAKKNRQHQPRPNGQTPPRQGDKASLSNPTEGTPGENFWLKMWKHL